MPNPLPNPLPNPMRHPALPAPHRSAVRLALVGLMALPLCGCGGGLTGRVLKGDSSFIQWVSDARASSGGGGEPIGGAAITVIRNPLSPGREHAGNGVSQADGTFTVKLDAFGAGWTDEQWLIVVERRGAGRAEYIGRLESGELLVLLAPGTESGTGTAELWRGDVGAMPTGSSIMDEAKRYR